MADSRGEGALRERLAFIGLDGHARAALAKLQPLIKRTLGPALAALYDKIKATPETGKLFRDDAQLAAAKSRHETHWELIAAASYSPDYLEAAKTIGLTHARAGLRPQWYIGGYALVMEQLIHAVIAEQWPRLMQLGRARPEDVANAVSSLVKAAMLDMDIGVSVYIETLDELRRRSAEAQDAAKAEVAAAAAAIASGMAKLAAKDLTYRLSADLPPDFHSLQADFNDAIAEIEEAMQGVACSAGAIAAGTKEISAASDDLSQRTEQQAASLEETAAALDEITATVKKTAEGAAHARKVVAAADEDARKAPRRSSGRRGDGRDREVGAADQPDHRRDRRDRVPDQPAGAERRGRGGARRRRGARFCRRRLRGAGAGAALGRGGQGDQGPDLGFDGAGRTRA